MENENVIDKDFVSQHSVDNKPIVQKRTKRNFKTKKCDVLLYNAKKKTATISFDGCGFEIKNVEEHPGKNITVKYFGELHSKDFRIEV